MNKIIGAGIFDPVGGGGDTTAPTLSSATIATTGLTISLVFDEAVQFGAGGNGGWVLTMTGGIVNGASVTMSYASGSGTTTLVYNLSRKVFSDETGSLNYTQPGNGVEDTSGNDLASISGRAVTNSSTQVWLPTEIAGLKLWLKADAIVGLSNNDPVGTWPDSSGLGYDFTQSTASKKPLYKINQKNGLPAIVFDDTDDSLTHATFGSLLNGNPPAPFSAFFALRNYSYGGYNPICFGNSLTGARIQLRSNSSNPSFDFLMVDDTLAGYQALGSTVISDTSWYEIAWTFGADSRANSYINSVIDINNVLISPTATTLNLTALSVRIIAGAEALHAAYHFGEVLVYDSVLSAPNRSLIDTYLNTRWAIY